MKQTVTLPATITDKLGNPCRVRMFDPIRDHELLVRMYESFLPKRAAQGLPPETDYALRRWLSHVLAGGTHMIVEVDGSVCGHLMMIPMQDADSTELAIFLHQSIRGRGIGTGMNRLAISKARAAGFKRVWLSVEPDNIPAIRSYQKAGFLTLRYSMWAPEIEMEIRFA